MSLTGLYFEDYEINRTYYTNSRTITEADHVNFTTSFGFFESLFMDQPYVETHTPYGKRVVPGMLTLSTAEGLAILSGIFNGTGVAFLGLEMKILKPVFIGDTITVEIEVVSKRETKNQDRGIVTYKHLVINQEKQIVMTYQIKRMIKRKA